MKCLVYIGSDERLFPDEIGAKPGQDPITVSDEIGGRLLISGLWKEVDPKEPESAAEEEPNGQSSH